ncbi:hypothetical protein BKA64DRAFT_668991 [Cadophora sp. MPI-SDFR-AT-0126]|nr:hypothetical protein BKA64DRAFT_668991 [Leotiomycetes sp. MPI-SDFR-AT-0126]
MTLKFMSMSLIVSFLLESFQCGPKLQTCGRFLAQVRSSTTNTTKLSSTAINCFQNLENDSPSRFTRPLPIHLSDAPNGTRINIVRRACILI